MNSNPTIHVHEDSSATLTCPFCGVIKHIDTDQFRHASHTLSVRCRCQQIFTVQLDFRRHSRKQTDLPGTYAIIDKNGKSISAGLIRIKDLSMSGIGLSEVGFTVAGLHLIENDQELRIKFQLNDKEKTLLNKRVLVKSVRHDTIGCQFKDICTMEKALEFFMQG